MLVSEVEIRRWFPNTGYWPNHADRLAYAFSHLPDLPQGCRCLLLGSWGIEAPYLMGALGCSCVTCVRAPEKGLPRYETITVEAPNALGSYDVDVYSLNLETEEMPDELKEFDLVLMWEILEHLCADPAFMIWQGLRTLKKGGVVCLTTPNALWHFHTINHIFGVNSLGLRLQLHIPFWTHWRLYSPAEVREMFESMGCKIIRSTTFLRTEPYSWKSRLFHWLLEFLRRNSGNGTYSLGLYVYIVAQKESDSAIYRPDWLYPQAVYHR